jgi:hypothetical protein
MHEGGRSEGGLSRQAGIDLVSTVCARSENQNSIPLWNSKDASTTTMMVGTLATIANSATSRTCSRPFPPIRDVLARRSARRLAISTMITIAATRLATSSSATIGGVSSAPVVPSSETMT